MAILLTFPVLKAERKEKSRQTRRIKVRSLGKATPRASARTRSIQDKLSRRRIKENKTVISIELKHPGQLSHTVSTKSMVAFSKSVIELRAHSNCLVDHISITVHINGKEKVGELINSIASLESE